METRLTVSTIPAATMPAPITKTSCRACVGSALLISLLMLSLITIIAVAFLGTMSWEISASRRNYDNQKAQALAMLGMNSGVAQLRHALDTWDNPYFNFATNAPTFYWSMSPGLITRWSYTSTTPLTNYPLFSIGSTNLVNLNASQGDGTYPIAGITNTAIAGATAPNISVYWVNVLKFPGTAASSANNPIIGRYAFWIDDENAKININTADGTMKYQTNSLGLGSPSEVSLQALQQGGSALSTTTASNIVYLARTTGLNSPREILRAAGTAPDLYTNNSFNVTAYSRSPDLNIFGQPKMALMPMLGADAYTLPGDANGDMTLNGITLQPPTEIYPTPSQLAPYFITNAVNWAAWQNWFPKTNAAGTKVPWPLAVRQTDIHVNIGEHNQFTANGVNTFYARTNYPWVNGMVLANYLAGTNAAGTRITWPPFDANTSGGFVKKYTQRQIDSIVAQILDLGSRDISPDYPNSIGLPGPPRYQGTRLVAPFFFMGWLSHQVVSGISRGPKLVGLELQLNTAPATGTPATPLSYYPSATLGFWEEWWLPSGYLGGQNKVAVAGSETITQGWQGYQNVINAADLDLSGALFATSSTNTPPNVGAPFPRADFVSANYWGNQLLTNNQGIDFQGNPSTYLSAPFAVADDPDQGSASTWHNPFALKTNAPFNYFGGQSRSSASDRFLTPFSSVQLSTDSPAVGWAPGEIRGVPQRGSGKTTSNVLKMWTNAGSASNPNLVLGGGIQVHSEYANGSASDPEPVPLDSIRGTSLQTPTSPPHFLDGEFWTNSAIPYGTAPPTVRDRFLQAVIPVNMTVPVPPPNSSFPGSTSLLIKPADPLVNKFPGDWVSTPITALDKWATVSSTIVTYTSYDEYDTTMGFHASLADPDSFWMPQLDCVQSDAATLPSQILIPRSARFPSIGYLQYMRTGVIPDDESNVSDLLHQHGTPYRLLSFAPLTDTLDPNAQMTTLGTSKPYPDWALFDLLYVPSILYPFGGPYGYYNNVSNVWQGGIYGNNRTVLANYSTGGGSTPGRINPNGMVAYTTNANTPTPNISRTLPMQAVLYGLKVNQSLVQQAYTQAPTTPNPGYTGGSVVDYSGIAQAIYNYISANGPLRMPGELCNVPEIAALRPSVNHTRNDLIRQIIGNLTTQSNTFSVWVAGQSIAKSKANTSGLSATDPNWGVYQSGDQILATSRYHFVVERYLDPGADGVYGNTNNAGVDLVYGTYDDPVDPINHPFQPRYLYRVVSSEEIR